MTCLYFRLFWINRNDRWKLTSGVRYPHLLSCISPNLTNDRNSLILSMFVASCYSHFISAISWLTMHNHSACQWIGWYDFPIRGDHTSCWGTDFLFDTKNYPITHPWIWRFCTWWTKSCTMNAGKMKTQGLLSYKNHNKTYTLVCMVCLAAALYDGTGHSIYTSNTWRPFLATTLSFPTSGCPWHFMRQRGGAW